MLAARETRSVLAGYVGRGEAIYFVVSPVPGLSEDVCFSVDQIRPLVAAEAAIGQIVRNLIAMDNWKV
jgi:hypothetical protein